MAAARELDPEILIPLYHEWKAADSRHAKGQVALQACEKWGISPPTIYKKFNQIDMGHSGFDVAKAKVPRKKSKLRQGLDEQCVQYAKVIASYKYATRIGQKGYVIPTESAIQIAIANGSIKAEDALTRSATDRWLKKLGISNRDFAVDKKTAVEVIAYYANEVWYIDATPINKHFLTLDGGIKHRPDLDSADKHLDDILQRDGLHKIWMFCAVDLHSHAYFSYCFAPKPTTPGAKYGGENAITWMEFLDMAFLPKENYPIEGLPDILYSDRFSGIKSNNGALRNYLSVLNIKSETHLPKQSRAKGLVEGRQSAIKRSFETILNLFGADRRELNLESLNKYFIAMMRKQNFEEGLFSKFGESAKTRPLRRVTLKNLQDARVRFIRRKLDIYKCVSVKWSSQGKSEKYFIEGAADKERGYEFRIFRNVDGKVKAQDQLGKLYDCDPRGKLKRHFGDWKLLDDRSGLADTEAEKMRKEVVAEAPNIRRSINFDTVFPAISNIISMRPAGEGIETSSIVPPEVFDTADEARAWLAFTSRTALDTVRVDVRDAIDSLFENEIKLTGHVSQQTAMKLLDILIKEREQNNQTKEML